MDAFCLLNITFETNRSLFTILKNCNFILIIVKLLLRMFSEKLELAENYKHF